MPGDLRPRGIGDFGISEVAASEPVPVDGDDLTWDWHLKPSGGSAMATTEAYDVRTGPERLSFLVSARLYAFERQLALLQQRVAELEKRPWWRRWW